MSRVAAGFRNRATRITTGFRHRAMTLTLRRGWFAMKMLLACCTAALLSPEVAGAHIGSSTVFYEGAAGPYQVRVVVRPPTVVPGLAEVTVRVLGDEREISAIQVRPVYWRTGSAGSPRGDAAVRVAGADPIYAAKLWLMVGGSYAVQVTVSGDRGSGTASVPVAALATEEAEMSGALLFILAGLGTVLLVGLVTIAHAGAGEGLTEPGAPIAPQARRRARIVAAAAVPLLLLVTLGGWRWWQSEAEDYRRSMYRMLDVDASVDSTESGARLVLAVTDSSWLQGRITPVIPDHGKMMHMFVMREPALDVFAHLHPTMIDSATFVTPLPPLPAGRYRIYADVVHESGFERTLVAAVDVDDLASPLAALDEDDSWVVQPEVPAVVRNNGGATARTSGGLSMRWTGDGAPLVVDRELEMRFALTDDEGVQLELQPYMGMLGHAAVTREDGEVFVHLHPMGTVTMASQATFEVRDRGDTTEQGRLRGEAIAGSGDPHAEHRVGREAAFPYAFPRAGRYRIWVQLRYAGRVHTAAFDADVR
jgi:hypothetical protein